MTADERDTIRRLVDRAKRDRIERSTLGMSSCSECHIPLDDVNYQCQTCRERVRSRQRRQVKQLEERVEFLQEIVRGHADVVAEKNAEIRRLKRRVDQLESERASAPPRYETDAARLAARRRTFRESKRRARQAA